MARLIRTRWIAATVVALLVAGGGLAFAATRPSAPVELPSTTPQRLVADVLRAGARTTSISGTVAAHVAVGLPSLPEGSAQIGPAGLGELLGYLSGDHQIRVWASRDGVRVSELIEPASEISFVANAHQAWAWNSDALTAYRILAPSGFPAEHGPDGGTHGALAALTPEGAANAALHALQPTSIVRLGQPVRVAGRTAYALDVIPKTSDTLVGRVEVDIDSRTDVPLGVAVYARGASTAALSVAYRSVTFAAIPASTFQFTPPHGAKVVTLRPGHRASGTPWMGSPASGLAKGVRVVGTGWSTVVAVELPAGATAGGFDPSVVLPISGPLFSARMVEPQRAGRRWILFGAVPQWRLLAVARLLR